MLHQLMCQFDRRSFDLRSYAQMIGKGIVFGGAIATTLSILLIPVYPGFSLPNWEMSEQEILEPIAPGTFKTSSLHLGEPIYPEYSSSPFAWWRAGSDQSFSLISPLPSGFSEVIMEMPAKTPATENPFAPANLPQPAPSDRINLIQTP